MEHDDSLHSDLGRAPPKPEIITRLFTAVSSPVIRPGDMRGAIDMQLCIVDIGSESQLTLNNPMGETTLERRRRRTSETHGRSTDYANDYPSV